MTVKLKPDTDPSSPFSWDGLAPSPPGNVASLPSPPTSWLSARDMKTFGAAPLLREIGIVRCKECSKPVLRSAFTEHADNCALIRSGGKKGLKVKADEGKKRKAEDEPDDPSQPKKKKPAPKVTKGRQKGPVDYDKQCGVINDKGLPCSRSLTCKSHSMGAKRAVQGRSQLYDDLFRAWNREHNPNWVEPVKRETKAEKKEKKDREKAEKKRIADEAALAAGLDPKNAKKGTTATSGAAPGTKKGKKASATAPAAAGGARVDAGEEGEDWAEIDSEAELEALVHAVRSAQTRGIIGVPLAVPADTSAWFVARRERVRNCRDLLANALMGSAGRAGGGIVAGAGRLQ